VAAGLAVWFLARPPRTDGTTDAPGIAVPSDPVYDETEVVRIKGDASLVVERVGPRGLEPMHDGDLARTGDRLQLRYLAADREQGAIVSIDGRGVATLHFPATVEASPRLASGGAVALDHSYELDDAPEFERFFFVTVPVDRTLDVAVVHAAAAALAASPRAIDETLALPDGYEQTSLVIRKAR
jgi:hypothetical protein